MALNAIRKQDNESKQLENNPEGQNRYLEILGDTVLPKPLTVAVILSIILSLSGYTLGLKIFPSFAQETMVPSYSLLLGIGGSVISLVICAVLFKPSRILTEEEASTESMLEIFRDMQLDPQEEYQLIENDPVIKREMVELGIYDKFKGIGEVNKK